jgi:signal transduction histidine kinase
MEKLATGLPSTGLPVGRWLAFSAGALLSLAVIGIGLALGANARLTDRRTLLVDRIAPAQLAAADLANALVNQETGVRGFVIAHKQTFLQPYRSGLAAERRDYGQLLSLLRESAAGYERDVHQVMVRAQAWQSGYVARALPATHPTPALDATGKRLFDAIRRSLRQLNDALAARRLQARADLSNAGHLLLINLILAGVLIIVGVLGAALLLRRIVTAPLARLGEEARRVAAGDFRTPLANLRGAREIVEVRDEVDTMRELIVRELAAVDTARGRLQEQTIELERSNADLEQFAYVASHDLQEPLRKVTSFCQALEHRYAGQLDDRADQYIHFAVDGAKRMQILINGLLAFSRVGRSSDPFAPVDAAELVAGARTALSGPIEEAGATVIMAGLPAVRGDRALLDSVFQNLIGNALKFRGSEAPVVRIEAHGVDRQWEFSCADNGIGIEPEYAERIFLIFQRLHPKESYPGTGIGLAMCRKIIEYHGGRIWLDTSYVGGTCIRFTLPAAEEIQS